MASDVQRYAYGYIRKYTFILVLYSKALSVMHGCYVYLSTQQAGVLSLNLVPSTPLPLPCNPPLPPRTPPPHCVVTFKQSNSCTWGGHMSGFFTYID